MIRKTLSIAVAASVLLCSMPAMAQVQNSAQTDKQRQLEEVIVTARKRRESIMTVPVVVTEISGSQLTQYETGNLSRLSDEVAGLNLGSGSSAFGTQVSLRGIGTSVLDPTIDQSVSLNIDGMQITQGLAYSLGMFDMARVEVYKGPQALFYGKASPAGVISITTKDPTDQFGAIARAGYEFEAKQKRGELIVSGPVTDTLGLRLAGQYSDSDGFFKNKGIADGYGAKDPTYDRVPNNKDYMVRGTALWEPTDSFSARLKLNYSKADIQGAGWDGQMGSCPDGTSSNLPFQFLGGGENCHLDRTTRTVALEPAAFPGVKNNGVPFSTTKQGFDTLELNYEMLPGLTLTSVTGWYHLEQNSLINATQTTYAGPPFAVQGEFDRKDFTQEVRLTSDFDSPVNFMVGGFYQAGSMDFLVDLPANQPEFIDLINLGIGQPPGSPLPPGFAALVPPTVAFADHHIKIDAGSVFGQVLWNITPKWELGVGARWTHEKRSHRQKDLLAQQVTPLANPHISSDRWSPELTLSYRPTEDLTLFGSLKQAYKSGSFDTSGVFLPGDDSSFKDEKVQGAELGFKSRLFDGTLLFNAATYYYKYDNLQVGANTLDVTGNIVIRTQNAASAKIYGVDLDATYLVPWVDGLTVRGALEWNHARYDNFDNAPCWGGQTIAEGCDQQFDSSTGLYAAQDLSGKRLVRAPNWTWNVSVNYERPIVNDMTLTLGATTSYSSSYYTNLLLRSDMRQDDYFKANASVALRGAEDRWEVAVIGTNLFNKIMTGSCVNANFADGSQKLAPTVISGASVRGPGGVEELFCTPEPGRALWLRLTLKY